MVTETQKVTKNNIRYSNPLIRVGATLAYQLKINAAITIYVLNQFSTRDTSNVTNNHICKVLHTTPRTVKRTLKALIKGEVISKKAEVIEHSGATFVTVRTLTINTKIIDALLDADKKSLKGGNGGKTYSKEEPIVSEVVVESEDERDARRAEEILAEIHAEKEADEIQDE